MNWGRFYRQKTVDKRKFVLESLTSNTTVIQKRHVWITSKSLLGKFIENIGICKRRELQIPSAAKHPPQIKPAKIRCLLYLFAQFLTDSILFLFHSTINLESKTYRNTWTTNKKFDHKRRINLICNKWKNNKYGRNIEKQLFIFVKQNKCKCNIRK